MSAAGMRWVLAVDLGSTGLKVGLVSTRQLAEKRRYAIVGLVTFAAIVTPPDVVSQLALAIPMCILYEVGIWAAVLFVKHTQAPEAEGGKAA